MPLLDEIERRNGDLDAIITGLVSKSVLFRFQAICGAVNHRVFNDTIKRHLMHLTGDGNVVIGYSISQLAIAALDKFGVEKYKGDDPTILKLLDADKWFDR